LISETASLLFKVNCYKEMLTVFGYGLLYMLLASTTLAVVSTGKFNTTLFNHDTLYL